MIRAPQPMRELARATAEASDSQLMKLVRALDAMPERGSADSLLDPVRARLRRLQPPRPVNLPRLLFLPLDALLVPARDWKLGQGHVPRTVILPLAAWVSATAPGLAAELGAAVAGHRLDALHLVSPLGDRIGPVAAALPPDPPPDAGAACLSPEAWEDILATCRRAWRHAPLLWRLRLAGPQGPPEAMARPVLLRIAAEGPVALNQALATLLPFAAQPSLLATTAASLGQVASPVGEQALDRFIAQLKVNLEDANLDTMAQSAQHFATFLEDLHGTLTPTLAARAQNLRGLKLAAGRACIAQLEGEAGVKLAAAVLHLAGAAEVPDAVLETLEASTAALRALADAARRLDHAAAAEAALRPAISILAAQLPRLRSSGPGLLRADALRLLELLDGPDTASCAAGQPGARTLSR